MSYPVGSVGNRPPPHNTHGGGASGSSGRDLKKIVGAALMVVGALFTLYGAASGLWSLLRVSLDNFGTVCILGLINFIFWSCVATPLGGLVANALCFVGAVAVFAGIPAIPGIAIAGFGTYIHFNA